VLLFRQEIKKEIEHRVYSLLLCIHPSSDGLGD